MSDVFMLGKIHSMARTAHAVCGISCESQRNREAEGGEQVVTCDPGHRLAIHVAIQAANDATAFQGEAGADPKAGWRLQRQLDTGARDQVGASPGVHACEGSLTVYPRPSKSASSASPIASAVGRKEGCFSRRATKKKIPQHARMAHSGRGLGSHSSFILMPRFDLVPQSW